MYHHTQPPEKDEVCTFGRSSSEDESFEEKKKKVGDALDVLKVVAHAGTHEEEEHEGGAGVLRDTLTFHSHLSWSLGEPGPALRLH